MNSNILQFFIKMKDLVSGPLVTAARNAHTSTSRIQRDIDGVTSANRRMGQSFSNVNGQIRSTTRELNSLHGAASRAMNGRSGFNPAKIAAGLGLGVSLAGGLAFAKSSVSSAMQYGATEKSFGVLTGSAGRGKALAGELNSLQQNTILGPEVFKAAQTMLAFGIETDKVVKLEKQLGDVSMGNKDKFEALTLAISQTTAAGRLQGQDLLQFVNAGFNPLQTMSEHWQEFGFKAKKSMGELKNMMEKGQISSAAVAKSLEIATGAGGKFANMMDQMAETSSGRLQILEGQYENFKIQVGNALMPVAESLMSAATATLDWLNITETAPAKLAKEQAEIHGLVGMITNLNISNGERASLIDKLVQKFPDLYGGINKEKIANEELALSLGQVNLAYQKRIDLASSQLSADTNNKLAGQDWNDYIRKQTISDMFARGDADGARSLMTLGEKVGNPFDSRNADNFSKYARQSKEAFDTHSSTAATAANLNAGQSQQMFLDMYRGMSQQDIADKFVGRDKQYRQFMAMGESLTGSQLSGAVGKINGGFGNNLLANPQVVAQMQALLNGPTGVSAAKIAGTDGLFTEGKAKKSRSATDAAQGIVGGGPRQIIINGVNMKVADTLEVHGANIDEIMKQIEPKSAEMFLRILNSGAKVQ